MASNSGKRVENLRADKRGPETTVPKYLEYQREKVWKPKAGNQDVEDAVGKRV